MKTHDAPLSPRSADCGTPACTAAATPLGPADASPAPSTLRSVRIPAMDCSAEESEIRRALEPIAGVRSLRFALGARTLGIDATDAAFPLALEAIRKAGFRTLPLDAPADAAQGHDHGHGHDHDHSHDHAHADAGAGSGIPRLVLALVLATTAELLHFFAPHGLAWQVAGMAVAGVAILLAGLDTYRKGIAALARGRLNINALMSVAVTGAFLIGQWPEAAMVMALYALAELIEARAVDRARSAIQTLLALAPPTALVQQADGGWASQPVQQVPLAAVVRIRPGERVPLDGVVVRGASAVDQAPVTGESIPVDKAPGDTVFAGTVNTTGELEFRVTAGAADTTLARIIHAVEEAQGTRAPTQRFVDRFAAVYTPAVFAIALAVAVFAPWVMGIGWLEAVYKALVLLVIACPCALVISTPVTVVSGLAGAARRGILVKGGTYLEEARGLRALAVDKTGTVTEGRPRLVDWQAWDAADPAFARRAAVALAARSDHPVSRAIAQGLDEPAGAVDGFTAYQGRGVGGAFEGRALVLGNHRMIHERGLCSDRVEAALAAHEARGRSLTVLADEAGVLAIFAVADTIRPSSREAIAELERLGVTTVMLTGDNPTTAAAIAREAGIGDARGDLLPEDKLEAIRDLQRRHGRTGMAGDGINDAPALARADIGFAMGGAGTDTAMEAADVVIMNDDLRRVADTVRLSRRTHRVLWQNITLALGIKAAFLVLAVAGNATMWMAVFADMGASLLVVANGLRLLRPAR